MMKHISGTYYVQKPTENSFHQNTLEYLYSTVTQEWPTSNFRYRCCGGTDHVSHAQNSVIHSQSLNLGLEMITSKEPISLGTTVIFIVTLCETIHYMSYAITFLHASNICTKVTSCMQLHS